MSYLWLATTFYTTTKYIFVENKSRNICNRQQAKKEKQNKDKTVDKLIHFKQLTILLSIYIYNNILYDNTVETFYLNKLTSL